LNQNPDLDYIISYFPIISTELTLASSPEKQPYRKSDMPMNQKDFNYYKNRFFEMVKLLFNKSNIYIYEINNYSDRFYFPNNINVYNPTSNRRQIYQFISDHYSKNSIYTSNNNIKPATGKIVYSKKIKDGYEVEVTVEQEGVFIFNTFFSPYWTVYVNDQVSKIYNFSDIHTGVELEKGVSMIQLKYKRELFKDKLDNFL